VQRCYTASVQVPRGCATLLHRGCARAHRARSIATQEVRTCAPAAQHCYTGGAHVRAGRAALLHRGCARVRRLRSIATQGVRTCAPGVQRCYTGVRTCYTGVCTCCAMAQRCCAEGTHMRTGRLRWNLWKIATGAGCDRESRAKARSTTLAPRSARGPEVSWDRRPRRRPLQNLVLREHHNSRPRPFLGGSDCEARLLQHFFTTFQVRLMR